MKSVTLGEVVIKAMGGQWARAAERIRAIAIVGWLPRPWQILCRSNALAAKGVIEHLTEEAGTAPPVQETAGDKIRLQAFLKFWTVTQCWQSCACGSGWPAPAQMSAITRRMASSAGGMQGARSSSRFTG
jgi:hypothetical protein